MYNKSYHNFYITFFVYYDNVKLKICHVPAVDDLHCITGIWNTIFSCADQIKTASCFITAF